MSKKIAIISGASRGLGKEIAIALSKEQFKCVITYVNNIDKAHEVLQQIKEHGGEAIALKADVGKFEDVENLFEQVKQQFGKIDVVINTAGISILKPLQDFDSKEFSKVVSTNVEGTFNILHQAARYMEAHGRILTFSSNVVDTLPPHYSIYAASKSAVETMSKVFSKELRKRNITVNIISPGPTGTDMFLEGKSPKVVEHFAQLSPFERLGEPKDIINVVQFLVRPEADWINGQVIKVNGGAN